MISNIRSLGMQKIEVVNVKNAMLGIGETTVKQFENGCKFERTEIFDGPIKKVLSQFFNKNGKLIAEKTKAIIDPSMANGKRRRPSNLTHLNPRNAMIEHIFTTFDTKGLKLDQHKRMIGFRCSEVSSEYKRNPI